MKRIIGLLMVIALAFLITSCGPNSDYFNVGTKKVYYYGNEPLVINPFDEFINNNDWIEGLSGARKNNPQKYYDVKVEYRKANTNETFKVLELKDDLIYFENPASELGAGSYEFKLHFLDKEEPNEKEMINYYVIYSVAKSPVNYTEKEVTKKVGTTYNLLDNVVEYGANDQPLTKSDLQEKYEITYKVTLNNEEVTVTEGEVTLSSVGTYYVEIQLKSKQAANPGNDVTSGASGNDGASGASPAANGEPTGVVLLAAGPLLNDGVSAASSDGSTGATPGSGDSGGSETYEVFVISYTIKVTE